MSTTIPNKARDKPDAVAMQTDGRVTTYEGEDIDIPTRVRVSKVRGNFRVAA